MTGPLSRAFLEDPIAAWLFPHPESRARDLSRFFLVQLRHGYLPRGTVKCSFDFQATAMWISSWARPLGIGDRIAHLRIPILLGDRFNQARQLTRALASFHPREPHLYLGTIGTSPEAQSRGYGSLLVEAFLDDARKMNVGAYLECSSEHNVGFYRRFGFDVRREVRAPGDGPTLWLMWRKADSPRV